MEVQIVIDGIIYYRGPVSEYLCKMNQKEVISQGIASIRAIESACWKACRRVFPDPCPHNDHLICPRIKAAARHAVHAYDARN